MLPSDTDARDFSDDLEGDALGDAEMGEDNPAIGPAVDRALGRGSVETALSKALDAAATAGRFDVVAQLAKELEARRLARSGNIVALDPAKRGR
jgi:hypothetical protein